MEVIIDSRLTAYMELREKALIKRDKASLYRLAQVYSGMKGKKSKKKAYETVQAFRRIRVCRSTIHDGTVQRKRNRRKAKHSNSNFMVYTGRNQRSR